MVDQISSLKTGIKYKDTPIGKIPMDWEAVTLGTLVYLQGGFAFKSSDYKDEGIPLIRISNVSSKGLTLNNRVYLPVSFRDQFGAYLLKDGDALVAMSGATTGKVGVVTSKYLPALFNQRVGRFVIKDASRIDKNYVSQVVLTERFKKALLTDAAGGAQPNVSSKNIEKITIPLPSLSEQKKIAEILTTVDDAIEKTTQVIEKTKEVKKGLMQRLLTRGIGHRRFKKTEIGEIPIEWNIKSLIEVLVLQRGFDLPVQSRIKGQYPVLASNGVIDYHQEFKVMGPGIVTGRSGTLGKVHYIESNYWPLNTTLYVKNFYNNHPKFIYYFLQSLNTEKYGTGTGVPTLNRNILHKVIVAIPPLSEQIKIAYIISHSDAEIEKEMIYRAYLEQIKNGLMQVLLTGKIRVKT